MGLKVTRHIARGMFDRGVGSRPLQLGRGTGEWPAICIACIIAFHMTRKATDKEAEYGRQTRTAAAAKSSRSECERHARYACYVEETKTERLKNSNLVRNRMHARNISSPGEWKNSNPGRMIWKAWRSHAWFWYTSLHRDVFVRKRPWPTPQDRPLPLCVIEAQAQVLNKIHASQW